MGLPGFMSWLLKKYKNKILLKKVDNIDHFYIDTNCLLHPECMKVRDFYKNLNNDELEKKMFKRIKLYLTFLYNYVNSKKTIGTVIDGVCPMSKMIQQRKRRFKTIEETKIKNDLKKKYNIDFNEKSWSNTVITPGTKFMEKLHEDLLKFIKKKALQSETTFIYSSYHTAGEGEHTILQHIKENVNPSDSVVIYGLDADLIFLAMTSGIDNIYLLREEFHFDRDIVNDFDIDNVNEKMVYISINELKNSFNNQIMFMINKYKIKSYFTDKTNFSNDLIIICFLLGNDFLPHFPSIDVYKGGLDDIINEYINSICESNTLLSYIENNKIKVNQNVFNTLCYKLGRKERNFFENGIPYFKSLSDKKYCKSTDPYEIELWKLEHLKTINIVDNVKLGYGKENEWKHRYYEHYFGLNYNIENIIKLYIDGIMWVAKYYFEECPSWTWFYPYDKGPFISDVYKYLNKHKIKFNNIEFEMMEPLKPMTQLMIVLPPKLKKLLPKSYIELIENDKNISHLYPEKVELDFLYKSQFWQTTPILPVIEITDIKNILNVVKTKKLSKSEKKRNESLDIFEF
jgi:5'-3' exonuclease